MQHIAILSTNYRLAPIDILEKVTFAKDQLKQAVKDLKNNNHINACVILSTCGRLEIYVASEIANTKKTLIDYLTNTHNITEAELEPYVNYFENDAAIRHICIVAAGLDSLALGEPQILGQLKDAYHIAKDAETLNKLLEKLFQHAFSTAKKVRTDTKIGYSPISIAYYAVKLSEKIFTNLAEQTILLIGAGEMIELCAQHLNQKNIKNLIIANRTIKNAEKISSLYNASTISIKQISSIIHKVDIIISSTAASIPIIGKGLIETTLKLRKHKPIFILDLAMPRDIEPEVGKLNDVFLYTINDLQKVVSYNINSRKKEKTLAEKIIKEQNKNFIKWLNTLPNEQIIQIYYNNAHNIKDTLIKNALKKLNNGADSKIIVQELADKLTNKLLHTPFKNIKTNPKQMLEQCKHCIPKSYDNTNLKNL